MYRDEIIDYLVKSGFVDNYCKKLVYPSDKTDLQDDFIQECWLQVLEIPESKWIEIIDSNKNLCFSCCEKHCEKYHFGCI